MYDFITSVICSFMQYKTEQDIGYSHAIWVTCHHGMAHSEVSGGGDSLQI
jgi:hypothetical protein